MFVVIVTMWKIVRVSIKLVVDEALARSKIRKKWEGGRKVECFLLVPSTNGQARDNARGFIFSIFCRSP